MFFKGSRYEKVGEATYTDASGREIKYKRIRFTPATSAVKEHTVEQADRPDLMAYKHFQDPELFWRICDVNLTMLPDNLTLNPGARILIPPAVR